MVKFVLVVIWVMWSIETASGKIPLYEPYFGVDVGDFAARAVARAGGVVDDQAVGKLIGCTVTALDDDGDDGFEEIIGPFGLNFIIPNFLPHGPNDGCDLNISCP